ncbi:hypothetical protein [Nostoc sp. MS1]|uniref:hypothetical protein n=1 Tax=Nostoc sp. MS1 TaxID=2764711 RepID=UPI001CC58634|nr:hypothetical protein [Nostoc sp. MS1]
MNRFQKLSSIAFLLLAFIYPPKLVEAKENTQNNVLNEQSINAETNLVEGASKEILLAHRYYRQRYHRRRVRSHHYRRRYYHRPYYRHYYRRGRYYGYYRHGGWELVRDRHGRLLYDWRGY